MPSANNFPGKEFARLPARHNLEGSQEVIYQEGIYVGYRYYDAFKVKPAYEFGYGLSYTEFKFGDIKVSSKDFKGASPLR